jgi:phytol kinase
MSDRYISGVPSPLDPFVPDLATMLVVLPLTLLYASAAASFAGWLRVRQGVPAPYTRKVFHFLILSAATLVHLQWGLEGTVVYGSTVCVLVVAAVLKGAGFAFYESIARPSDAPRQSLLIIVPLATTALGGVLANLFFPGWAHIGYAAVAWGDAIGEPVGARWGHHRYTVPSIGGVSATRSIEGSAAVLFASAAACAIVLIASGSDATSAIGGGALIGAVTTLVEAISHHGMDNLTIQLAAAGSALLLFG